MSIGFLLGSERGATGRHKEKGSILILALWALMFLSLLTVVFGSMARQQIILAGNIEKRNEVYGIVSSGTMAILDTTASIVKDIFSEEDIREALISRPPFSSGPVRSGNGMFFWNEGAAAASNIPGARRLGIIDEGGKINVNYADEDILTRLFFITAGVEEGPARALARSVIDWRDADDVLLGDANGSSESVAYSRKGYSYVPRNKPLVCVEELMLIDGMVPEIFFAIRDHVTVFGRGRINVNTASVEVLMAMGLGRGVSEKIELYREGDGTGRKNFGSPRDIPGALGAMGEGVRKDELRQVDNLILSGFLGTKAEVFSLLCAGRLDGGGPEGRLLCVFGRNGKILYWGYQMTGEGGA